MDSVFNEATAKSLIDLNGHRNGPSKGEIFRLEVVE